MMASSDGLFWPLFNGVKGYNFFINYNFCKCDFCSLNMLNNPESSCNSFYYNFIYTNKIH
jgi:hypothetical protein